MIEKISKDGKTIAGMGFAKEYRKPSIIIVEDQTSEQKQFFNNFGIDYIGDE